MPPLSLKKRIIFSLIPVLTLLSLGELTVRLRYFALHRDVSYLIMPFGAAARPHSTPVAYPYKPTRSYTKVDSCSGRTLTFTVNTLGGRGPAWSPSKRPNTVRVMALGASSTFGVNSPDEATWPALLEQELRRRGEVVEVLNVSSPGIRVDEIVADLPQRMRQSQPDVVLLYEAFNNATAHWDAYHSADVVIERFHANTPVGRLTRWLHYRSMLYTYLLEKLQFYRATHSSLIAPEVVYFRTQLQRLFQIVQAHGATPIVVLQVTEVPPEAAFQTLDVDNRALVEEAILTATQRSPWTPRIDAKTSDPRFVALRAFQTQVLVEIARRTAREADVQVIDPRAAFLDREAGPPLFCDVIHLTDAGNQVLAEAVAGQLDVATRRSPQQAAQGPNTATVR